MKPLDFMVPMTLLCSERLVRLGLQSWADAGPLARSVVSAAGAGLAVVFLSRRVG